MAKKSKLGTLVRVASMAVTIAAVAQELRRPPQERRWHGRVAGFVPYDFRLPTLERMRASWWSPTDERVLTPQVWGVGWTVNFGRVVRLSRESRTH
jgi:hypothetical protein